MKKLIVMMSLLLIGTKSYALECKSTSDKEKTIEVLSSGESPGFVYGEIKGEKGEEPFIGVNHSPFYGLGGVYGLTGMHTLLLKNGETFKLKVVRSSTSFNCGRAPCKTNSSGRITAKLLSAFENEYFNCH